MQAKKEIVAGKLYMMTCYSAGFLPSQTPKQRAKRQKMQTEYRKKINKINRKYSLMQLLAVNFKANRDLFICLSFANEPTPKDEQLALRRFHNRMSKFLHKKGKQYKYILARETHGREGEPVKQHYHLICSGTNQLMNDLIIKFWGMGSVDVQNLKELTDNFEDTCNYLLKEEKSLNERAYRCSRNLKRPEPLRRKIPENECGTVPDGVKIVKYDLNNNDFGRYEILIAKIIDETAFNKYWELAKLDKRKHEADRNWRRYAKMKRH